MTCACAIDDRLILESASVSVDIEVGGETTRGFSSIYPARLVESWPDRDPNARVIRSADTGAFVDMLVSVLR